MREVGTKSFFPGFCDSNGEPGTSGPQWQHQVALLGFGWNAGIRNEEKITAGKNIYHVAMLPECAEYTVAWGK
jgi:hypothetical protein